MKHAVKDSMLFYFGDVERMGNPSSVHWAGRKARTLVDEARDQVAAGFGLKESDSLVFTSSGTEAINLALKGAFFQAQRDSKNFQLLLSPM